MDPLNGIAPWIFPSTNHINKLLPGTTFCIISDYTAIKIL